MENENIVNVNKEVETEVKEVESKEKTFTQEELDKIVQKRLAKERKDIETKIAKEREEAEELAKLSEAEKQKKLFEKQVKEFEETKKAFERERLLNQTKNDLASKNLPIEFSDMLLGVDAETTLANINTFEEKFNVALEKAVTERFKGKTPKTSTANGEEGNPYSKEHWSLTKQMELEMTNPSLALTLSKSAK